MTPYWTKYLLTMDKRVGLSPVPMTEWLNYKSYRPRSDKKTICGHYKHKSGKIMSTNAVAKKVMLTPRGEKEKRAIKAWEMAK